MQSHVTSRRYRLHQAALAAPVFSTATGEQWALLPRGLSASIPVRLKSKRYREWLYQRAEEKAGLMPGAGLLNEVILARQSDASHQQGETALRVHYGDRGRVLLHLGGDSGDCLRISQDGWGVEPAPEDLHFRYPERRLPLPQPIHTADLLPELLGRAFGLKQGVRIARWLVRTLTPDAAAEPLVLSGSGRSAAAAALTALLDPRSPMTREPDFHDDWLLVYYEFSRLKLSQVDHIRFAANAGKPVLLTAGKMLQAAGEFTQVKVGRFEPFDAGVMLGAVASAVADAIRVPQVASSSPSRS